MNINVICPKCNQETSKKYKVTMDDNDYIWLMIMLFFFTNDKYELGSEIVVCSHCEYIFVVEQGESI